MSKPIVMERGVKYRDADKMALIPVKNVVTEREALLRKPEWMKIKLPADSSRIQGIKAAMRKNGLHSVCEEASCPNLAECFNHGTATFMILGLFAPVAARSAMWLMVVQSHLTPTNRLSWLRPLLTWRFATW
ncbi:lipoyl synthase [Lelliottia amnigena]|nr:lipoyl synthase [Lelliottia amnigena]